MNYTHRVTVRRLHGTPYSEYAIVLPDGRRAYAHLSPYGPDEIEERICLFLAPPAVRQVIQVHAKRGPKPKPKATLNERGFLREEE